MQQLIEWKTEPLTQITPDELHFHEFEVWDQLSKIYPISRSIKATCDNWFANGFQRSKPDCVFNMTSISQIRGNLAEGHSDHKIHADFQQNKPISSILRLFPCSFATLSPPHMPINSPHWFIRHLQTLGVIYNGRFAYRKVDGGNGAPRGNTCRDTVHTPGLWHCEAAALMPQQE